MNKVIIFLFLVLAIACTASCSARHRAIRNDYYKAATRSPKAATRSPKAATRSPQTATPSPQTATPSPQTATPSPDSSSCGQCPAFGSAASFAILAATTITNTGATVVNGNIGVSPGTAITGFPPGIVIGTIHAGDPVAASAKFDANSAYNNINECPCTTDLTGVELGGLVLTPGVYCFATSVFLSSGILTLDAQGDPNAIFIFKTGTTFITGTSSSVLLINGAMPCNVFFNVGSSATLGVMSIFNGVITAQISITANSGTSVNGRLFAINGAVTLDTNSVNNCACS